MPKRGAVCALRVVVLVAAATSCAGFAGAAPATTEGCTAKPEGPAPQGQHWYYVLDRATKRQCWHLGPLGLAVQKSAKTRPGQGTTVAPGQPVGAPAASTAPAAAAAAAPVAPPIARPVQPPLANALAPLTPPEDPPAVGSIPERPPLAEPKAPAQPAASATRSADAIAPAPALAPPLAPPVAPALAPALAPPLARALAPPLAPASRLAEATRPAVPPAHASGTTMQEDHSFALIVLAAALLIIAGPVLWITRLLSRGMVRAERRSALALRIAPDPAAPN